MTWILFLLIGLVVTITVPVCAGCCGSGLTCSERYGTDIEGTFTGVTSCDGCYTDGPPGDRNDYRISFTGLSGVYSLTWEETTPGVSGRWFGVVGEATLIKYDSDDGTCTTELETTVADIILSVVCGIETGIIQPAQAIMDGTGINFFLNSTETTFGAVRDNELACVEPGNFGVVGAFDGSLELNEV